MTHEGEKKGNVSIHFLPITQSYTRTSNKPVDSTENHINHVGNTRSTLEGRRTASKTKPHQVPDLTMSRKNEQ
ncbi:hypothetical protein N7478_012235 [Penicillium angulare]|uniref:uncharacterized protein n=1 Tax=Penicillium angulare TaxID=116970 RepID=UPI0025416925|nr:uncharacterized protein N7478_012235 [Penicillium angulare]KAJ5259254.1 hypothetical protein N7478_012235 [Penicillium angulare]